MTAQHAAPSAADLDAARLLLSPAGHLPGRPADSRRRARPGADVRRVHPRRTRRPVSDGTRRVYGSTGTGLSSIGAPAAGRADTVGDQATRRAHQSANVVSAATHAADAAPPNTSSPRCVVSTVTPIADGHITRRDNPARKVAKPRRLPSTRRAVPDTRLAEINHVAATTGNDPALDALLLRLHTETACRRGGALALQPGRSRRRPMPHPAPRERRHRPLATRITNADGATYSTHADQRAAPPDGQLLRYADGRPITSPPLRPPLGPHRHAPSLGRHPTDQHPLASPHHPDLGRTQFRLRRRPRLRRTHRQRRAGTTATYVRANLHEVAAALAALTGEPHPLAANGVLAPNCSPGRHPSGRREPR